MKILSAKFIKSGTRGDHYPDLGLPEIAFAGRSNVGKSSLMNSMMSRKSLVKVSSTPGRTQLLSWFTVNENVVFCDLPGYGFAKVPGSVRAKWGGMVNEYLAGRETLLTLAILADVRRGFQPDDMMLMSSAAQFRIQPILVATKCDKLKRNALYNRKRKMCAELGAVESDIVWYSAVTHSGRDNLWRRLTSLMPTDSSE
jgi:GTP-binding protein